MIASMTLLAENDYVGMTFWLATSIMLASTVFFFIERADVAGKWRTSMTVASNSHGGSPFTCYICSFYEKENSRCQHYRCS